MARPALYIPNELKGCWVAVDGSVALCARIQVKENGQTWWLEYTRRPAIAEATRLFFGKGSDRHIEQLS